MPPDAAGRRRRCPLPRGPSSSQQGQRYPADPLTEAENATVMAAAGDVHGVACGR
jgi:hypothetical protein